MASLYKRRHSAFWWLKHCTATGRIVRKSTKLRVDSTSQTRKAQALAHEHSARELRRAEHDTAGRWDGWVPAFLTLRYGDSPSTLLRYRLAWRNVSRFLDVKEIPTPSALSYAHCIAFIDWRQTEDKKAGNYAASHNTALTELKVLGVVMREAVRRDYAARNPCVQLGIKRVKPAEKPEFADEHLAIITVALEGEPQWMLVSFTVGLHTGLRLRETNLWMPTVDLERKTIVIERPKGGVERAYSIPFGDALAPLLTRLKSERPEARAFDWPDNLPSKEWYLFFQRMTKEHGLPHYCFHCLRVSFITRGARNGVPENVMMKLVNHASTTVHRIYQRLRIDDVRPYLDRLRPNLSGKTTP